MDKGKPIGVLECGDLFKTRATRRWGKMYGNAPGVGSAVKIAAKLEDVPATPLRWLDPRVLVDPIGYVLAVLALSVLSACGGGTSGAVEVGAVEGVTDARPCEQRGPGIVTGAGGACFDTVRAAANLKEATARRQRADEDCRTTGCQAGWECKKEREENDPPGAGKTWGCFPSTNTCGFRAKLLKEARKFYSPLADVDVEVRVLDAAGNVCASAKKSFRMDGSDLLRPTSMDCRCGTSVHGSITASFLASRETKVCSR